MTGTIDWIGDSQSNERLLPRRIPIMSAGDFLRSAATLVDGDRALDYGDKLHNHQNIAAMWNAYLFPRPPETLITALDVAVMMLLMKVARVKLGRRSTDTFVDMCGYSAIAGELSQRLAATE